MKKRKETLMSIDKVVEEAQNIALKNVYIPPGLRGKIEIKGLERVLAVVDVKKEGKGEKILFWGKPKKTMTKEEREESFASDSGIPGTYVPNMSDSDVKKWKAKLVGHKSGHPQVEISKDNTVIIIAYYGYKYKHYKPEDTKEINVHISSSGPIQWSFEDYDNFQKTIKEAMVVLNKKENQPSAKVRIIIGENLEDFSSST